MVKCLCSHDFPVLGWVEQLVKGDEVECFFIVVFSLLFTFSMFGLDKSTRKNQLEMVLFSGDLPSQ